MSTTTEANLPAALEDFFQAHLKRLTKKNTLDATDLKVVNLSIEALKTDRLPSIAGGQGGLEGVGFDSEWSKGSDDALLSFNGNGNGKKRSVG